jgi:hypothetical protein
MFGHNSLRKHLQVVISHVGEVSGLEYAGTRGYWKTHPRLILDISKTVGIKYFPREKCLKNEGAQCSCL